MHFPATRILTVLELLQSRRQISGPELAARLEVDVRTIRRYIIMLQDLGIPVEAQRGRYGTYRLRPGFKLPPLMFNDDEALALTLGLLLARKMVVMVAAPAIEGALAKVERVLPEMIRERVQAIQETLIFDVPPTNTFPQQEVLVNLSTAAQQEKQVVLQYRSYKATQETERIFDPYGLVYRTGYWYVVGHCHLRNDLRTFRLDRIQTAIIQTKSFTRPADFDVLGFVLKSISQTPGKWFIEVILETTLAEAQKNISPALALLEEVPTGVRFCCYTDNLSWIAGRLVSLPYDFTIHQPDELRTELLQFAQRITSMAQRS